MIPPGYTWNTAPFPFRKYCRMLTLCWQKAGGKAPAFARARYDDEEQMFCQIRVLLAFVQICTHHICCTINKALQLKNNFLQLRCVFCHRVFFLKKNIASNMYLFVNICKVHRGNCSGAENLSLRRTLPECVEHSNYLWVLWQRGLFWTDKTGKWGGARDHRNPYLASGEKQKTT